MTDDARDYLTRVLDIVERNAVMADRMDWTEIRREARAKIAPDSSMQDGYAAIRAVLSRLGDRHSFFLEPEQVRAWHGETKSGPGMVLQHPEGIVIRVIPGSAAERAGLEVGDRVHSINGEDLAAVDADRRHALLQEPHLRIEIVQGHTGARLPASITPAPFNPHLMPEGRQLAPGVGYLELPAYVGHGDSQEELLAMHREYASTASWLVREMEGRGVRDWVIDLRRNTGGNMVPMLLGIGSLLGEGECLAFVGPKHRVGVHHQHGAIVIDGKEILRVDRPYRGGGTPPLVAVLMGRPTASSGELVALALRGVTNTRSFGEATAGIPTDNEPFDLPDGARLLLTVALGADRTGRTYADSLQPDETVAIDWPSFGTEHDPVVRAALTWMQAQRSTL